MLAFQGSSQYLASVTISRLNLRGLTTARLFETEILS